MKRLDFVIAGVARSGTTQLTSYLSGQPNIKIPFPLSPEPKFFSRTINYDKGIDWYFETYFKDLKKETIIGEKSTEYFESIDFPKRASRHFPDLKIILMFRNPVERTISNYSWSVKNGMENRSFYEAITAELSSGLQINGKTHIEITRPQVYIGRSLYFEGMRNLLKYFSKEQILSLNFSEYSNTPIQTISKIESFLGISFDNKKTDHIDKNKSDIEIIPDKESIAILEKVFCEDVVKMNGEFNLSLSSCYNLS